MKTHFLAALLLGTAAAAQPATAQPATAQPSTAQPSTEREAAFDAQISSADQMA